MTPPPGLLGRFARGPRLIGAIAVVAVLALAAGVLLSRFVISPAQLAADAAAPPAGPIVAPLEERVISNTITTRADAAFADAVDVKVDSTGLPGPAVVTGHVPEVGATLDAGAVALEVAGRPLIVLPGELPAYRSLHSGLSGPDVLQLKAALAALGLDPGDLASDLFDAATAAALDGLYRRTGYPSPSSGPEAQQTLRSAREAEQAAVSALAQAQAALDTAGEPPTEAARIELDNAVRAAQRALDAAVTTGDDEATVDGLRDELRLAQARRDQLDAPAEATAERAAVAAAERQLADAQEARARAEEGALTTLPSSEVLFLTALPRRVDTVAATRGAVTTGSAMSVSGARLVLRGTVSEGDAALLRAGQAATFRSTTGSDYTATIASVAPAKKTGEGAAPAAGGEKRYDVEFTPQQLDDATRDALKGSNVKVSVAVSSTEGAVLAAPVTALTAGPGGESRLEVVVSGEAGDRAHPQTALIDVTTGLAADGWVEVRSDDPRVAAGAGVVVGR